MHLYIEQNDLWWSEYINSYPEGDVHYDDEYWMLDYTLSYDVKLAFESIHYSHW